MQRGGIGWCRLGLALALVLGWGPSQAAQICQPAVAKQSPAAHWQRQDALTILNTQTGLVWQACSWGLSGAACEQGQPARLTWPQAQELVYRLNRQGWGGANNWRLPTQAELTTLLRPGCLRPNVDLRIFPNTPALWFWSDEPGRQPGAYRQYLDFATGWPGEDDPLLANAIRLVRPAKTGG